MVSVREAAEGGLATVNRPGGGGSGTARADQVLRERGARPPVRTTSDAARRNALGERQVGGRLDVRSARPEVTAQKLSMCFELVRERRPELPVRGIVDGHLVAGLEMTRERGGDGWLIGCVSSKHWTRNLNLDGFPDGLIVTVLGPNGIMVRPAPLPVSAPYVVTTAGTRA
jgi:hypothetical protein